MLEKMKLSETEKNELKSTLQRRFEANMHRHEGMKWDDVLKRIADHEEYLRSLIEMEISGGEPDVVKLHDHSEVYYFIDCAQETPEKRRNLCFDEEALRSRKNNKPEGSAKGKAEEMGVRLLTEEEYRILQTREEVDMRTSSWIDTPLSIRKLGGALFGDRRFNAVFIYHNGAESYYGVRGFRGILEI